jgi:hypothetical protein
MRKWKHCALIGLAAIIVLGFSFIGCDNDVGKQTPVVGDFNISGIGTFDYDGTAKTVTITPKPNKSTGEITVYYNGSVTAPIPINTYSVTFDVAESEGFNEANGLLAGSITINPVPIEQPYLISNIQTTGGAGTVNVTINYTALPNVVPSYMPTLEGYIKPCLRYAVVTGELFINIVDGDSSFKSAGAKTLEVGESWIIENIDDEDEIIDSILLVRQSWCAD